MVDKTNDYHAIDLAWLRREKLLRVGRWSSINWSRNGHRTGSIQLQCVSDGVRLVYRTRPRGGEWTDVSEIVPLIETETRFGGGRQWFLCLTCRGRCRILYGGTYFRCRRCHGLKYETQYEPAFARAATRALKIRERLGSRGGIDDPFPVKPKDMHWKTYEQLRDEAERLEGAWARGIAAKFRLGDLTQ
jgi:hypothetical protein